MVSSAIMEFRLSTKYSDFLSLDIIPLQAGFSAHGLMNMKTVIIMRTW